ncbi:hypothetical protein IC614_04875 [Allosphingosinicella flava]|uniref:DUF4034 domain-containing protein n=1 Tax=Allosphingosinicella flava TaxID=2771430 RepID=A0A7T2GL74_9SPHN|nr:DUF6624 domain-containing protein [Sphingosinicella flava]QPQ55918.1 hypothetical protein IC614_04875 [Sphingosinicella flava]
MFSVIVAAALAVSTPSPASDIFAWRQSDAPAFQLEKARLDALLAASMIGPADSERLARMMVAEASTDATDYAARWDKIAAELKIARAKLATMKAGGPYADESHWLLKARAATADPDARALFERVFLDQSALTMRPELDPAGKAAFRAAFKPDTQAILLDNVVWLKAVLGRIGWFDISKYGERASQAAWLVVQHADHDPDWQKAMLETLAPKVKSGDMQGTYYAYLVDRVAVNAGKPQTYGTQGGCVGPGDWQPKLSVAPEALDRRRAEVGLESIAAYRERLVGGCA